MSQLYYSPYRNCCNISSMKLRTTHTTHPTHATNTKTKQLNATMTIYNGAYPRPQTSLLGRRRRRSLPLLYFIFYPPNGVYPCSQTSLLGRRRRGNSSPGKCSCPVATPRSADRLPFITIVYLYLSINIWVFVYSDFCIIVPAQW